MSKVELRDYQKKAAHNINYILQMDGVCIFQGQQRVGKTLTAAQVVDYQLLPASPPALVVTKKSAIDGIQSDFAKLHLEENSDYILINYESVHKVQDQEFQMILLDECHSSGMSTIPNASKTWKAIRYICMKNQKAPVLMMSGTTSIESKGQLFFELGVTGKGPWEAFIQGGGKYPYQRWWNGPHHYKGGMEGGGYGTGEMIRIRGGQQSPDYKKVIDKMVMDDCKHHFVTLTRKDAGFKICDATVIPIEVENEVLRQLVRKAAKSGHVVFTDTDGREHERFFDSPAERLQAAHILSGGTFMETIKENVGGKVKERKVYHTLDDWKYDPFYKVNYIKEKFNDGKQYVVFTKYIHERNLLKLNLPNCTTSKEKFLTGDYQFWVASITTNAMGVDLSWVTGGCIMYSTTWSGQVWSQVKDRQLTFARETPAYVWVLNLKGGVDDRVLEAVENKDNFNSRMYKELEG